MGTMVQYSGILYIYTELLCKATLMWLLLMSPFLAGMMLYTLAVNNLTIFFLGMGGIK